MLANYSLTAFLTEELLQRLSTTNSKAPSICINSFPIYEGYKDFEVDKNALDIFYIIHEAKSILQEFNIINTKPKINISIIDMSIAKNNYRRKRSHKMIIKVKLYNSEK